MTQTPARLDRYELMTELASGGMATVYLGRQHGALGFVRYVAIKSMHAHLAKDEVFRRMFLDEAQLSAKIRHPNVVPTLDVVSADGKLLLVMEYVDGVALSMLLSEVRRAKQSLRVEVVVAVLTDALQGLHAAHELIENGELLGVVHRDVSPHNIQVGADGIARLLDFGIAKAAGQSSHTRTGELKGKTAYMSPEQLAGLPVDRRTDVYAAGVVLWEALAGRRLFAGESDGELALRVMSEVIEPPSVYAEEAISDGLDRIVLKALSRDVEARYPTAQAMAEALRAAVAPANHAAVKASLERFAAGSLHRHERAVGANPALPDVDARAILHALTEPSRPSIHRSSSRTVSPLFAAALGVVLTVIVIIGLQRMTGRGAEDPPSPAALLPTAAGLALSSAPVVLPEPSPAVPLEPVPPAASMSASTGSRPRLGIAASRARAPVAPSARPPPRDCDPAYVVDAEGQRHYKPECFP